MQWIAEYENRLMKYLFKQQIEQEKRCLHQSHINSKHMFVFRVLAFVYMTLIFIWTLYDEPTFFTNIKYLTLQGYTVNWLYFTIVIQDYLINKKGKSLPKSPNLKYLAQATGQIAFCLNLPITLVFWTVLFPEFITDDKITAQIIALNANLHLGPFVWMTIDVIYNHFTFQKKRCIIIIVFSVIYLLINLIYTLTVQKIYPPIDWKSLFSYLIVFMSWVMTAFCFWLGRKIHNVKRKRLQQKMKNSQKLIDQDPQKQINDQIQQNQ